MILRELRASNFRLLEDFELEFQSDVTVLIGPNNSGKSNIVDALLILKEGLQNGVRDTGFLRRGGFDRVVSRANVEKTVSLGVTLHEPPDTERVYEASLSAKGVIGEKASLGNFVYEGTRQGDSMQYTYGEAGAPLSTTGGYSGDVTFLFLKPEQLALISNSLSRVVHIDPFRQVSFQTTIGPKAIVEATGSDLAPVLHYHYNNERERFDLYEERVRKVVPEVDIIETPIIGGAQATVSLRFVGDSTKYNLWQISSGLKDILILLAALHFSPRESLIILEEPENHLHPASQKGLCTVIREAAEQEGRRSRRCTPTSRGRSIHGLESDGDRENSATGSVK